jgi:hypothetical protein
MQIPFSPALEKQMYPTRETIGQAIRKVAGIDMAKSLSESFAK